MSLELTEVKDIISAIKNVPDFKYQKDEGLTNLPSSYHIVLHKGGLDPSSLFGVQSLAYLYSQSFCPTLDSLHSVK